MKKWRRNYKKKKSYRVLFIDSPRSIASALSNLVKNLAKEIHKNKCKYEHDEKKSETWGVEYKYCKGAICRFRIWFNRTQML